MLAASELLVFLTSLREDSRRFMLTLKSNQGQVGTPI